MALPRPRRDAHSGPAVRAVEKSEEDRNIVGALMRTVAVAVAVAPAGS